MSGYDRAKLVVSRAVPGLLIIVLTVVSSGCYFGKEARKARAFESGQKFVAENRLKEAQIQFQRAVNLDPNFAMAQYMLGSTSYKLNDPLKAYRALLASVKLRPAYFDSNRDLADLLILSKRFKEARPYAEAALKAKPGDSKSEELLAYSYGGAGDLETAEKELEDLVEHDPGAFSATMSLARLKLRTRDAPGAEAVLKNLTEKKPSASAFISLGNFYLGQGKAKDAEESLKKAVAIDPKSPDPLYQLGLFYLVHNRVDEAEPVFQKLSAEHQDDPRHRGALARFHYYGGQKDKGVADLQAIVQKYPDDLRNRNLLINALIESNRNEQAQALLSDVLKKDPKDPTGLLGRGIVFLKTDKPGEAINDLLEVLHREPGSSVAHFYMGMAQLKRGSNALAKQEFGDALKYQPTNLQARVALAELLVDEGSTDAALEMLRVTPPAQQNDYAVKLEKARAEIAKSDFLAAEQDLTALTRRDPNQPAGFANLGALQFSRKDWKQALPNFQQALKLDPHNEIAVGGLAQLFIITNQAAAGEAVYAKMAVDNPKSSTAAIGLALVRQAQHKEAEAEKGLRQFLTVVPGDVGVLKMVADLRAKSNDIDGAEQITKQIIKLQPDDASGYSALATIYMARQRPVDALQQYREVLKRNPNDVSAQNNLAWLITQTGGNIDEALALAQKGKEKAPSNAEVTDTLGWIYLKKNNVDLAMGEFQDALHADPKNQLYLYHLGVAQFRKSRIPDATRSLTAAVAGTPNYPGVEDARHILQTIQSRK